MDGLAEDGVSPAEPVQEPRFLNRSVRVLRKLSLTTLDHLDVDFHKLFRAWYRFKNTLLGKKRQIPQPTA